MAAVPTGLQTCEKMLQMHLSDSGGTPWLQPKNNNIKFNLASKQLYKFFAADFGFKIFIIVATVPTGLQTSSKGLQMHLSESGGTPWLQPKSNATFRLASVNLFKVMVADFGFKYFHYSSHCAHRDANLCKSAANALCRGWGDTLVATQKYCNF